MPVDRRLLEILCCPRTRVPLRPLDPDEAGELNARIREGRVLYAEGSAVDRPVEEALITEDGETIYRIDDGIPVMLAEFGIPTNQLDGFR